MRPEDVGFLKTDLVLGKHSGRAALADRARALGFSVTAEQIQNVFEQFKELADKKKEIYDGDIAALIQQEISGTTDEAWSLVSFEVASGTGQAPKVNLTLAHDGKEYTQQVEQGDGPIDAAFWAVEKITGYQVVCKEYRVASATLGRDALGEVQLEIEHAGQTYKGVGVSTDTVEATILAMLNAANRIAAMEQAQQKVAMPASETAMN
jgi:2-isopropylmalate synthase